MNSVASALGDWVGQSDSCQPRRLGTNSDLHLTPPMRSAARLLIFGKCDLEKRDQGL